MEIDYDIASNIVDEGIPYSLEYYLNIKDDEGEAHGGDEDDEAHDDDDDVD